MTAGLVFQEYGSPERREFIEQWRSYESGECRVVEVADRHGQGMIPIRKICMDMESKR